MNAYTTTSATRRSTRVSREFREQRDAAIARLGEVQDRLDLALDMLRVLRRDEHGECVVCRQVKCAEGCPLAGVLEEA